MRYGRYDDYRYEGRDARRVGLARPGDVQTGPSRAEQAQMLAALGSVRLEAPLRSVDWGLIAEELSPFTYPPLWAIQRQGTVLGRCLVVITGSIVVYRRGVEVDEIGPGRSLGLNSPRALSRDTAIAGENLTGVSVDLAVLEQALNRAYRNPEKVRLPRRTLGTEQPIIEIP